MSAVVDQKTKENHTETFCVLLPYPEQENAVLGNGFTKGI
jgi:hypothetical protein